MPYLNALNSGLSTAFVERTQPVLGVNGRRCNALLHDDRAGLRSLVLNVRRDLLRTQSLKDGEEGVPQLCGQPLVRRAERHPVRVAHRHRARNDLGTSDNDNLLGRRSELRVSLVAHYLRDLRRRDAVCCNYQWVVNLLERLTLQ